MAPDSHSDKTLAIARFSALGDVAMAVPVVYSLCRTYPHLKVVMVTRPALTRIFVGAPDNLTLFGADVDHAYAGVAGLRRLARTLRCDYGVTDYVDIHSVLRTRLLGMWLRLGGVRVTSLVKDRAGRRALTRADNKVMMPLLGARARYRMALAEAGYKVQPAFDGLYSTPGGADASLFAAITPPRAAGECWIGIAPYAAHQGKIYPIDKMRRVVDILLSRVPGVRIFLFGGGGDEAATLARWQSECGPAVISLAGRRAGFDVELALMNHLDLMLAMDSGNMHLAAIAGTRVLSIWGATHVFGGFGSWRHSPDDIIEVKMPCRPCSVYGAAPCRRGDYMCLQSIAPETVAARVIQRMPPQQEGVSK